MNNQLTKEHRKELDDLYLEMTNRLKSKEDWTDDQVMNELVDELFEKSRNLSEKYKDQYIFEPQSNDFLVQKWEKSGLLDGLANKKLMAKIIENTCWYIKSIEESLAPDSKRTTREEIIMSCLIVLVRKVFADRCNLSEDTDISLEEIRAEIIVLKEKLSSEESNRFFESVSGWTGIDAEMELISKVYTEHNGIETDEEEDDSDGLE